MQECNVDIRMRDVDAEQSRWYPKSQVHKNKKKTILFFDIQVFKIAHYIH